MAELPIATQCGTGAPAPLPLDSGFRRNDGTVAGMTANIHPGSESGTCFRTNDTHETGTPKSEQLPRQVFEIIPNAANVYLSLWICLRDDPVHMGCPGGND